MVIIESEELKALVVSTIDSIEDGTKDTGHHLSGAIEFEVAIVSMEKAESGFKLYVVRAEGKYASENITKIKFKIEKDHTPPQPPWFVRKP
jgi:hypothetical protein